MPRNERKEDNGQEQVDRPTGETTPDLPEDRRPEDERPEDERKPNQGPNPPATNT